MDNKKLLEEIERIDKIEDFLEKVIQLKRLEKAYKRTGFYKETRVPLAILFKEYKINKVFNFDFLVGKMQRALNSLDFTVFTEMAKDFSEKYQEDLELGQKSLKDLGLEDFLKNLKP